MNRHAILISLLLATLLATPVQAGELNKEQLNALIKKANLSYRQGDFSLALRDYKAVYQQKQHPLVIFNMAQCHRQLGNPKKALFFYKLHITRWNKENPQKHSPYEKEVSGHIASLNEQLRQQVDKPRPKPAAKNGQLHLEGAPEGSQIFVDGIIRGQGPLTAPLSLKPGAHRLKVEGSGFKPWTKEITVEEGEEIHETLTMVPEKSTLWLVSGISTTVLCLGSLGLGIGMNMQVNGMNAADSNVDPYTNIGIAGYALAGVFAAASGVSWFMYWRSGQAPKSGNDEEASLPGISFPVAAIAPTPGGMMAAGSFRF